MSESIPIKNKTTITIEDNRSKKDETHESNSKNKEVSIECTFKRIHIEFDDNRKLCIENDDYSKYLVCCTFKKRPKQEPAPVEKDDHEKCDNPNLLTDNSSIFTKKVHNVKDLFLKLPSDVNEKFEITNRRIDLTKPRKPTKEVFPIKTSANSVLDKKVSSTNSFTPNNQNYTNVQKNNSNAFVLPSSSQDSWLFNTSPSPKRMKVVLPRYDLNDTMKNSHTNQLETSHIQTASTSGSNILNFGSSFTPIAVLNPQSNLSLINNQSTLPLLQTSHMINHSSLLLNHHNFNIDDNNNNAFYMNNDDIRQTVNQTNDEQSISEDVRLCIRNHIKRKKLKLKYFGEEIPTNKPVTIAPKSSAKLPNYLEQSLNKSFDHQPYGDSNAKISPVSFTNQDEMFMETPVDMDETDDENPPPYPTNDPAHILNSNRARRSPIWLFFNRESSWTMKCLLCNMSLIYKNYASWPLKMHLKSKHNIDVTKDYGSLKSLSQIKIDETATDKAHNSDIYSQDSINNAKLSKLKSELNSSNLDMDPIDLVNQEENTNLYRLEKGIKNENIVTHQIDGYPKYIQIPISHSEVGSPLRKFCSLNRFWQFETDRRVNDLVKCNEKVYFCGERGLFGTISDDRTINIPDTLCTDNLLAVIYSQERKAALAFSISQTICLSVRGKIESINHYYKFRSKCKFKKSILCMNKVYIQMDDDSIYYQKSLDNLKLLHRGDGEKSYLMVLRKPPRILIQKNEDTLLYYGQNFLKNIDLPLIKMTLACIQRGSLLIGRDNEVYSFILNDKFTESDTFSRRSIKLIGQLDPFDHLDGFDNHLFIVRDKVLECRKIGKEEIYPTHCRYEFDETITKLHIDKNGKIFVLVGFTIWTFDIL